MNTQDFGAAAMTRSPLSEADALSELADMGYRVEDLRIEVRHVRDGRTVTERREQVAVPIDADVAKQRPAARWFPDPIGRHEFAGGTAGEQDAVALREHPRVAGCGSAGVGGVTPLQIAELVVADDVDFWGLLVRTASTLA